MDGINVLAKQQDILPVRAQKNVFRGVHKGEAIKQEENVRVNSPSPPQLESDRERKSSQYERVCVYCRHREIRHTMQTRAS
jgi:hypothetical protein